MRAWMTIRELLDLIIEQVAIESGILLNDHSCREILSNSDMTEWSYLFDRDMEEAFGVRPEFIEDIVRILRVGVGNLPDATPGVVLSINKLKEFLKRGIDPRSIIEAFSKVVDSGRYKIIDKKALEEIVQISKMPPDIVCEFLLTIGEVMNRNLKLWTRVKAKEWDGLIPLSKIFTGEIVPSNPQEYLDQRFLDYLAANPKKLDKIHWRNFERLCAEFFNRRGFHVELGLGTADGGIDLRVWKKRKDQVLNPLIIIQCKRYKKGNKVDIECVKALWTDLVFENAKYGLLATTYRVAPGGKRICKVRKWPLSFAENEKVKKWTKSLWRHSPKKIKRTKQVGKYLLPPFVPFIKPKE